MLMKISKLVLYMYKIKRRASGKFFSMAIANAFGHFGHNSVVSLPIKLEGERKIFLGNHVYIAEECWLQTLPDHKNNRGIEIGSGTSIGRSSIISAAIGIVIKENVLIATNVCIVDHIHKYKDGKTPIKTQGLDKIAPIIINKNTWIGQNVVILPGVTVGENCVVGANSLVNKDIPAHSIAVGNPAAIIKRIDRI